MTTEPEDSFQVQIQFAGDTWASIHFDSDLVNAAREASHQFELFHDAVRLVSPAGEVIASEILGVTGNSTGRNGLISGASDVGSSPTTSTKI